MKLGTEYVVLKINSPLMVRNNYILKCVDDDGIGI